MSAGRVRRSLAVTSEGRTVFAYTSSAGRRSPHGAGEHLAKKEAVRVYVILEPERGFRQLT